MANETKAAKVKRVSEYNARGEATWAVSWNDGPDSGSDVWFGSPADVLIKALRAGFDIEPAGVR